jgi:hypothetical protein
MSGSHNAVAPNPPLVAGRLPGPQSTHTEVLRETTPPKCASRSPRLVRTSSTPFRAVSPLSEYPIAAGVSREWQQVAVAAPEQRQDVVHPAELPGPRRAAMARRGARRAIAFSDLRFGTRSERRGRVRQAPSDSAGGLCLRAYSRTLSGRPRGHRRGRISVAHRPSRSALACSTTVEDRLPTIFDA